MRKLILHIGHAKTGTSSLQKAFDDSSETLARMGVLYPTTFHAQQHGALKAYLAGPQNAPASLAVRLNYDEDAIAARGQMAWQVMLDEIEEFSPHTIVLSSETFFNFGRLSNTEQVFEKLGTIADEITVVAYLRSPADRYLSARQQNVKFAGTRKPPVPVDWYYSALGPLFQIDSLSIKAHHFDRNRLIDQDIISDFATRYLSQEASEILTRVPIEANASISPEAMALLEDLHRGKHSDTLGPVTRRLSNRIITADAALVGKSRPKYRPGMAAFVHQTATDLDWVTDTFDISFPVPKDTPQSPPLEASDLTEMRDLIFVDGTRFQELFDEVMRKVAKPKSSLWSNFRRSVPVRFLRRLRRHVSRQLSKTSDR